jgi:hypothetical protein
MPRSLYGAYLVAQTFDLATAFLTENTGPLAATPVSAPDCAPKAK